MGKLILASASPRRKSLLAQFSVPFSVVIPHFDESQVVADRPSELACRLADGKAASVADRHPDAIVIGADTVVALDGNILGKPRDEADAKTMLESLSGKTHTVITGLAVHEGATGRRYVEYEETAVTFGFLCAETIEAYVNTGEPFDKAGGYGIQGRASLFVRRVEGCYFNVVGLPLYRLGNMLGRFGLRLL